MEPPRGLSSLRTRNHFSFEFGPYYRGSFRYKTTGSNYHRDRHLKISIAQVENVYTTRKAQGLVSEKINKGVSEP